MADGVADDLRRYAAWRPSRPEVDAALQAAEREWAALAAYETDWDGDGALPPTAQARKAALALVVDVFNRWPDAAPERLQPFAIVPLPDGGVHVEWRADDRRTLVDVERDGTLGYLHVEGRGDKRIAEEKDGAPLMAVLTRIQRTLHGAAVE